MSYKKSKVKKTLLIYNRVAGIGPELKTLGLWGKYRDTFPVMRLYYSEKTHFQLKCSFYLYFIR